MFPFLRKFFFLAKRKDRKDTQDRDKLTSLKAANGNVTPSGAEGCVTWRISNGDTARSFRLQAGICCVFNCKLIPQQVGNGGVIGSTSAAEVVCLTTPGHGVLRVPAHVSAPLNMTTAEQSASTRANASAVAVN